MRSPFELFDEGADIIQEIIKKLGDNWRSVLGEELVERIEYHLEEAEDPYYNSDSDEEE